MRHSPAPPPDLLLELWSQLVSEALLDQRPEGLGCDPGLLLGTPHAGASGDCGGGGGKGLFEGVFLERSDLALVRFYLTSREKQGGGGEKKQATFVVGHKD